MNILISIFALLLTACSTVVDSSSNQDWMKVHILCYTGKMKIYEADVYQSLTDPSVRYHLKSVQPMSPPMNSTCVADRILE